MNPKTENFWVIDYRIFDPETDGLSKLDHVEEMLRSALSIGGWLSGRCSVQMVLA